MIELKENDLIRIVGKDNKVRLTTVERVEPNTDNPYITHDILFNNNFESQGKRFEIIAVWRYNEETGNYLKIYDKEELCQTAKPADIPYDKYVALERENKRLKIIITRLKHKCVTKNSGE